MFCAICSGAAVVMTSTNGTSWTERSIPNSRDWRDITWSPTLGYFVAVSADAGSYVMRSSNGINWTEFDLTFSSVWGFYSVVWVTNKNIFVAVKGDGNVATSHNGSTWYEQGATRGGTFYRAVTDGTDVIAPGDAGTVLRIV